MSRQIQALINSKNLILLMMFLSILAANSALASRWKTLTSGIEYQDIGQTPITPWAHIHAFRIDLKQHPLDLLTARDLSLPNASAKKFSQRSQALIAINGGFFDEKYHPLGLRISQSQLRNAIKRISWWGIFLIKDQIPEIISSREYTNNKTIDFAVQSGPRLIINSTIPKLRPGIAERSALGITRQNKVIILVTESTLITTTELAKLMQASPLNCVQALNLDGGSSSQLYAKIGTFRLNVNGFSNVSDAIVVK